MCPGRPLPPLSGANRGLQDADILNTLSEAPLRAVPEERSDGSRIPLFQMGPSSGAMSGDDLLRMIWDALGADQVTTKEATDRLEQAFGSAGPCGQGGGSGPGRYVTFPGFTGRVGFISAVSHQFCEDCNRVRLTAAGFLKTCLQYDSGVNLKALLDSGADKHTLRAAMERAIFAKPACHHFSASGTAEDERRSMYQIGG